MCEVGGTPQKKINTKDEYYTVIVPTALDGQIVMCVVIFTGMKPITLCETVLDLGTETICDVSDEDFLTRIVGKGNTFRVDFPVRFVVSKYHAYVGVVKRAA